MREREIVIRIKLPESPRGRWLLAAALVVVGLGGIAYAALPALPANLMSGTQAKAGDVMANFNALNTGRVVSPVSGGMHIGSAYITEDSTSGTAAIGRQDGTWLSGVSLVSAGTAQLNFASGFFSSAPICIATSQYNVNTIEPAKLSATSVQIASSDTSGTAIDRSFFVICIGPA